MKSRPKLFLIRHRKITIAAVEAANKRHALARARVLNHFGRVAIPKGCAASEAPHRYFPVFADSELQWLEEFKDACQDHQFHCRDMPDHDWPPKDICESSLNSSIPSAITSEDKNDEFPEAAFRD